MRWGLALCLTAMLLLSGCSRLMFFPMQGWVRTPAQLGIDYEDVQIVSGDGTRLNGWWLDAYGGPGQAKGTVIFFHGNAENISTHLGSVYWLPESGYQVLMIDYRGYGRSEGQARFPDVLLDITAVLEWGLPDPRVVNKPVFVLGQSLGGALSGYVMGTRPDLSGRVTGVVLDAAFASYRDITREIASRSWITWLFQYPASWTMPRKYDLVDHIDGISPTPLMVIHGRLDEVIPFEDGERLFEAAGKPKRFLTYNGPHIQTFRDLELRAALLDFFADAVRRAEAAAAGD